MPYTIDNPPDAIKGIPKHAQEIYIAAFNSAFEEYKDEGKAAATAWAAVKTKYEQDADGNWKAKESLPVGKRVPLDASQVFCPKCDGEVLEPTITEGESTWKCLKCGTLFESRSLLREAYSDLMMEYGRKNAYADAKRIRAIMKSCQELLDPIEEELDAEREKANAKKVEEALREIAAARLWLKEQAPMKTEDGEQYPASAFAYVPDPEKPSTWKLRIWESLTAKATRAQLGRASAALSPGGYRGNRVEIPTDDLPAVKKKIRSAYRSLDVADEDIPKWVMETEKGEKETMRILVADYLNLSEAKIDSKGIARITVIKPGLNASKERYYPPEVLARDYKVFEGVKMYADHPTEHDEVQRPERSIRDWVATLKNVKIGNDGAVVGEAVVVEPWMQERLTALRDKNMLADMGVSINAIGTGSKGDIEGNKTNIIERIVRARSVDFVTEAGAGGGVSLFESAAIDIDLIGLEVLRERRPDLVKEVEGAIRPEITKEVKKNMDLETKVKELESTVAAVTAERDGLKAKITEAEKAKAIAETKAKLDEAIGKSNLPMPARERLLAKFKDAESDAGITEAIKAEADYIAKLTEAGKVTNLGGGNPPGNSPTHDEMKDAWKRLHPEWSDDQIEQAINGR